MSVQMGLRLFNIVLVLFLVGCTKTIDAKEAEEIAIQTAIDEGYSKPRLFTKYDTETFKTYHFSVKENKDIKTWKVTLLTDEREQVEGLFGDLIYFIDSGNGEVVDKISGVD